MASMEGEMVDFSKLVNGYPKLAAHMGLNTESAIFCRFSTLNAQNLLYLQAELTSLQRKLREQEAIDNRSCVGNKKDYARDWHWLNKSKEDGDEEQWLLVLSIREKLKEYNDTLLQLFSLSSLSQPSKSHLRNLRIWLEDKHMGNRRLIGEDSYIWGDSSSPKSCAHDLITLRLFNDVDPFTEWIMSHVLSWFHYIVGHHFTKEYDTESGLAFYDDNKLLRVTGIVSTVFASLLLILSIVVLYVVQPMPARLGIMAAFISIFSLSLACFTKATRGDIFAATAAFAAVQVVFIGTSPSNNG